MQPPKIGSKRQPFPMTRPPVTIAPSRARPFTVDDKRMPGWGVALNVGAESWMSWYDPPEWKLTSVSHQRALRPAEVHGLECVEVETLDWESSDPHWRPGHTHYARLTDDSFEWLAVSHLRNGKRVLYTFLDDGFDQDWGESRRLLKDTGSLTVCPDGTHTLAVSPSQVGRVNFGAGVFRVCVGDKTFTCLRSIELDAHATSAKATKASVERTILAESFHSRSGQLILFRRYNGRLWATKGASPYSGQTWDKRFPQNQRLTINGAVFVHWYDCLTDVGCRLASPRRR